MLDRLMGLLALVGLGAFLFVLVSFVPRTDLIVVVGACFALAAADFVVTMLRGKQR